MELRMVGQFGGLFLLIVAGLGLCQEDSLRSALRAIDQRQRDLSEAEDYDEDNYAFNGPNDLEFLSQYDPTAENAKNADIERILMNYLEGQDAKKHSSSSFREKSELDRERQLEELADNLLIPDYDRNDYQALMKDVYAKYKIPANKTPKYAQKRPYNYRNSNGIDKRKYYDPVDYSNDSDDPQIHLHQMAKRFPVSKRSSDVKRSTKKDNALPSRTDPKVAKELGDIFGTTTTTTAKPTTGKPILVKKKSIKWSDYFGLDRRKKSESLDKEWLMNRYHNAAEAKEQPKNSDRDEESSDDIRLGEIDAKLRAMEEANINDALLYTGSQEGVADSQAIQEVKDRAISRLAAAYSLEKVRRALAEYKQSVSNSAEQKRCAENKKRVVVPRKQAIDEDRQKIPEGSNEIKCAHGDDNCEEQNYRTPAEVLRQTSFDACPQVQRACNEASVVAGRHAAVFETACDVHQMCLLCSNNSWFAPTRHCNALFMTKAFELCDGNEECQKQVQKSIRYMLDVNRSLRLEPLGECESACPDKR